MKPHFGQSDAAMNKLAGINQLPNNNKPPDLTKLDLHKLPSPDVGDYSCVPCKHYEVSLDHGPCVSCRDHAKFEEKDFDPVKERDAAYDLGFKDAQGYYGHHNGCDCAVCEDMYNRDLQRKIVDAEWHKLLDDNATLIKQVEEIIERMGRDVQFWKDETRRAIDAGDLSYVKSMRSFKVLNAVNDKYRDALHIIAHMGISGLSWQHDYEKCVNIAKEALEI